MQTNAYGAHEVLELHEVMNTAIDACNTLQLFVPYASDPELRQMLNRHLHFMQSEYNNLVHLVHGVGVGAAVPYRANVLMSGSAGVLPQQPAQPNAYPAQMDDRDVASAMLTCHKSGAKLKMSAALESAHPQIRNVLLQGAMNGANLAYEVWGYMQHRGYYPLISLQETAQAQLLRGYQPAVQEQPPAMYMQTASPVHDSPGGYAATAGHASAPAPLTTGQPHSGVPKSSINASQIFSSPAYRQEQQAPYDEQTEMVNDSSSAQMVDPLSTIASQQDARPARASRKKGTEPDNNLTV